MASETSKPVIAIYPGSFDPVTNGHLDLIERGAMIFDKLIVAVAQNLDKDPLFPVKERVDMLEAVTYTWKNVEVDVFDGLLMDYAREKNALVVLRGIRAVSDYGFDLWLDFAIHHGHLQLVFVVGDGADAAHDHAGFFGACIVHQQAVEYVNLDVHPLERRGLQHLHALFFGE